MKKSDINFALRLAFAVVVVLAIMNVAHQWDEEDTQQLRMAMMAHT
ncbi:hypothetical protein [Paraburkholderia sp. 2C]